MGDVILFLVGVTLAIIYIGMSTLMIIYTYKRLTKREVKPKLTILDGGKK